MITRRLFQDDTINPDLFRRSRRGGSVSEELFGTREGQRACSSTPKGELITLFRAEVTNRVAGDWAAFFLSWAKRSEARHATAMSTALAHHQELLATIKSEKLGLLARLKEMESALNYMRSREEARALAEREAEERRMRRAARKRAPARNAAMQVHYEKAVKISESSGASSFSRARDRSSFLFLTGMRVSNLRELRATHLRSLLSGQALTIPQIKQRKTLTYPIPRECTTLVKARSSDIAWLLRGRENDSYVITCSAGGPPLNRVNLTTRLNAVLKAVGAVTGRVLTSHSFRIGLTTSIIERFGIDAARQILGHANISTTALYSRYTLTSSSVKQMLGARFRRKYCRKGGEL